MATEFKPSLYKALDNVGKTNGHNVPSSQDPITGALHEYHVTTLAESYFKKRRDIAKKKLLEGLSDVQKKKIDKAINDTKANGVGTQVTLVDSEHYGLQLKPKSGASFLDETKLRNELMTTHKMKADVVQKLFESCMDRREPALSYEVTEK